jgi:hypothetical protein
VHGRSIAENSQKQAARCTASAPIDKPKIIFGSLLIHQKWFGSLSMRLQIDNRIDSIDRNPIECEKKGRLQK